MQTALKSQTPKRRRSMRWRFGLQEVKGSVQSHHTGGTPLVGVTNTAYDSYYGRVLTQQLASGEWLWHRYSQYGHPILDSDGNSGQMYKELVSTNAYGSPTSERWGNLLTRNTTYWPNNQVKQITYQKSGSTIRQLNYAYDVFGNVSTQELNQGMAGNTLESFSYDALHRLTQSTRTGAANSTVSYGYDAAGNFSFKSDFSQNSLSAYGYSGTTGGPNAVKSVLLKNGSTRSYNYDAAGNLVSDNQGFNSRYDHTNRPLHAARSGVISNFGYTPDGTRFKETGTEQRHNFPGVEKNIAPVASVKTYLGDYAYVNTDSANNRSIKYLLTDRLGSVDAVTDGDGNLIETRGYDAFGAPRTGTWADSSSNNLPSQLNTPKGFTQHQHIAQLGLIHMNGRTYDPGLGRFLGVDPFIQMPTNSQSLNPYSYIMNNPLAATDPTGYLAEGICLPGDPGCGGDMAGVGNGRSNTGMANCQFCLGGKDNGKSTQKPKGTLEKASDWYSKTKADISSYISGEHSQGIQKEISSGGGMGAEEIEARLGGSASPEKQKALQNLHTGAVIAEVAGKEAVVQAKDPINYVGLGLKLFKAVPMLFKIFKAEEKVVDAVKVIPISKAKYGEAAEHIADAQKAGHPSVLTIARDGAAANRDAAIGGIRKVSGKQLDEYPPAMFKEGGTGASVRAISPKDNMAAGACIGNACRGLANGEKVQIKVVE